MDELTRVFHKAFLLTIGILYILTPALPAMALNRTALVIGNSAYKSAPLKNPVNDASDMALALTSFGFDVTLLKDATKKDMETAIRNLGKQLRSTGGSGLFYFAGHGMQMKGRNFLLPVDCIIESEADVEYVSVDAALVLGKMEDAGNDLNIVILDACRNNPFARSFRSSATGLARMDAPAGSILIYATAPGAVAADGNDRNGLYTSKLLQWMEKPDLEIGMMLRKVRADVMQISNGQQVPWESSSLTGTFYFVRPSDPKKEPEKITPSDATMKEPPITTKSKDKDSSSDFRNLTFSTGNSSEAVPGGRYNWTVFIQGPDTLLDQVQCVEYTLHPTFPNPVRMVCQRGYGSNAFPLSSNGWGTFKIKIRVLMKDGKNESLIHQLNFNQ